MELRAELRAWTVPSAPRPGPQAKAKGGRPGGFAALARLQARDFDRVSVHCSDTRGARRR